MAHAGDQSPKLSLDATKSALRRLSRCNRSHLSQLTSVLREAHPHSESLDRRVACATFAVNSLRPSAMPVPDRYTRPTIGWSYATSDWLLSLLPDERASFAQQWVSPKSLAKMLTRAGLIVHKHKASTLGALRNALVKNLESASTRVMVTLSAPGVAAEIHAPIAAYDENEDAVLVRIQGRLKARWECFRLRHLFALQRRQQAIVFSVSRKDEDHGQLDPTDEIPSELSHRMVLLDSRRGLELLCGSASLDALSALATVFEVQQDTYTCGVASVVVCLNSLFTHTRITQPELIERAEALGINTVRTAGLSLDEMQRCAESYDARTQCISAEPMPESLNAFRSRARAALERGERVVVNFDRQVLKQGGAGHHCPLAAYNAENDMFLLYDVAAFKSAPLWVHASLLHEAMASIDAASSQSRGYLIVGSNGVAA
jgi:hypothetical protein